MARTHREREGDETVGKNGDREGFYSNMISDQVNIAHEPADLGVHPVCPGANCFLPELPL
jgi:hypothetical protein